MQAAAGGWDNLGLMAMTPEDYTVELAKAWGGGLRSVILYGSAASGDHRQDSDYNLILVVDRVNPACVRAAARATVKWVREGNPAPLLMTPGFLANSADVYPLEWLDIIDHHRVLAGEDPVPGLSVSDRNLRLELERELKSSWLKLLGRYQAVAGSPSEVRELMVRSSSNFLTLFRGCLRLFGMRHMPPKAKVAAALAEHLGKEVPMDSGAFAFVETLRDGKRKVSQEEIDAGMERYLAAIEAVIRRIDAWT